MSEPLLHSYQAASEKLGKVVSAEWLSKHKEELPHCQFGTRVGFSDANLAEIVEMFSVRPGHKAQQAEQPAPLVKQTASPMRSLKPRGAKRSA